MIKNPDFEQNHYSRAGTSIYKTGHDSIRLMKRICYYDLPYYENINYCDFMGTLVKEITQV